MNPLQAIAALRKFGNYIAGVFPFAAAIAAWINARLEGIRRRLRANRKWRRFVRSPKVKVIGKVIERFYWKNYSKDRINLEDSPPESLVVLRPIFQLCILLCLLIPLSQFALGMVPLETFSGFQGKAPLWSICLWMIGLPCAWGSLLVGTAFSNRIAFAATAVAAAYFLSTCVLLLPRHPANALLTVALLLSFYACERSNPVSTIKSELLSLSNTVVVGTAAGLQFFILSPFKPLLIPNNNPPLTLTYGTIAGVLLGMTCLFTARATWLRLPWFFQQEELHKGKLVWSIAAILLMYLVLAATRGSMAVEAGLIMSSLSLTNNYLWPVWYFIGVGIIHKLVGSSKAVTNAVESTLPAKAVAPVLLSLLLVATLSCTSDALVSLTAAPSMAAVHAFFLWIYQLSRPLIWADPVNGIAAEWLSKVLIIVCIAVGTLTLQRKLTNESLIKFFYLCCLAAFLILEYLFQMTSLTKTADHSRAVLFFFSIWLLWLMHTVGWSMCIRSSPSFPAKGRLAIYAGIVTLTLLEIHSRAACADLKVVNELFLTMFHGAIDIGLPYFLYVWSAKKLSRLPIEPASMLGSFVLGAITALWFNAANKLSACHWSLTAFLNAIQAQCNNLQTTGSINTDLQIPGYGLLLQSLTYSCLLLMFWYRHKVSSAGSPHTVVFVLMAFASGVASFSRALVELPLSPWLRALFAPLAQETQFNCHVFLIYLAFWIPALLIGLAQMVAIPQARRLLGLATIGAILANFGIFYVFQEHETFMRAAGTLYYAVTMLAGVLWLLLMFTMQQLATAPAPAVTSLAVPADSTTMAAPVAPAIPVDCVQMAESLPGEEPEEIVAVSAISAPRNEPGSGDAGANTPGNTTAPSESSNGSEPSTISTKTMVALVVALEVLMGGLLISGSIDQFDAKNVAAFSHTVQLHRSWQLVPPVQQQARNAEENASLFKRVSWQSEPSFLQIGQLTSTPSGTLALMKRLLMEAATNAVFRNLNPTTIQKWDKYAPGALACYFTYDIQVGKKVIGKAGVSVLVPQSDTKTAYLTVYTSPSELERLEKELMLLVKSSQ